MIAVTGASLMLNIRCMGSRVVKVLEICPQSKNTEMLASSVEHISLLTMDVSFTYEFAIRVRVFLSYLKLVIRTLQIKCWNLRKTPKTKPTNHSSMKCMLCKKLADQKNWYKNSLVYYNIQLHIILQVYSRIKLHALLCAKPRLDIFGRENNRQDTADLIQHQAGYNRCSMFICVQLLK